MSKFAINFTTASANQGEMDMTISSTQGIVTEIETPAVEETVVAVAVETTTVEESVVEMKAVVESAKEFIVNRIGGISHESDAFNRIMDKNEGITVALLKSALIEMDRGFKGKDTKTILAHRFIAAWLDHDYGIVEQIYLNAPVNEGTGIFCKTCKKEVDVVDQHDDCDLCACERDAHLQPAIEDRPVAEEKPKEEVKVNTEVEKELQRIQNEQNLKALDNSPLLKKFDLKLQGAKKYDLNPMIGEVKTYLKAVARRYRNNVGQYLTQVMGIEWFGPKDRRAQYGVVGAVTFQAAPGHVFASEWDAEAPNPKRESGKGAFIWRDVAGTQAYPAVNVDQINRTRRDQFKPLPEGTGLVTLRIMEKDGQLVVRVKKSASKETGTDGMPKNFYDNMRTADIKWGLPHGDNNANLEAALTAFVRVAAGEFVRELPANRHGYKESCMNCRYMTYLGIKDGVEDDLVSQVQDSNPAFGVLDNTKSNKVLQQPDVPMLAQWGSKLPQAYCFMTGQYMDMDIILKANKAEEMERDMAWDSELGDMRWPRADEMVINGQFVKRQELREFGTKEIASECVSYHKNQYKGEKAVMAERVLRRENGESEFVSQNFTERAEAARMPVQTKTPKGTWVNLMPGEVKGATEFRIYGLGGVVVIGHPVVMKSLMEDFGRKNFIAPEEELDTARAEIMKKVNYMFYGAFNLDKLTQEQAEIIFELADNKPEGLGRREDAAWDNAVKWLFIMMDRVMNGDKELAPFPVKFHQGAKPKGVEGIEISAEDFIEDTLYRDEHNLLMTDFNGNSLGYKDLTANPAEFVRYLDEVKAEDKVYEVLTEGTEFYIKSKSPKHKVLVAGALQELLNRQVARYLSAVRRDADPAAAIEKVGLAPVVKDYLINGAGLKK